MRVFECDNCKQVNRIASLRLDVQPCCGKCGRPISDFPLSVQIRKAWSHRWTLLLLIALAPVLAYGWSFVGTKKPETTRSATSASNVQPPKPVMQSNAVLFVDEGSEVRDRPLTIVTKPGTGGYYVKVLYVLNHAPYLTAFVNAGSTYTVKLPMGTFEIAYSTGEVWLGSHPPEQPFWPTTYRKKWRNPVHIEQDHKYTLELFSQIDGNMPVAGISAAEFGE